MMQEPMTQTDTATNAPADEGSQEAQGIDAIIATVDSYIADPKTITPETLQQLKADLEDLKSILEPDTNEAPAGPAGPPQGGLAAMIGGGK